VRALIVSTAHPDGPTVFGGVARPLVDRGWDVTYVAPFAEFGVRPPAGVTGLDLPVTTGRRRTLRIAAGVLRYRGPESDLVVVSADDLPELERLVRRSGDGPARSCATPSASGSAGAGPDLSAIPRRIRRTTPATPQRADTSAR
jgi:hypothetical protein